MGLDRGEFWWRIFRFNWFGHQSRFDAPAPAARAWAPPVTGHLRSSVMVVLLWVQDSMLKVHSQEREEAREIPGGRAGAPPRSYLKSDRIWPQVTGSTPVGEASISTT